MSGRLFSLFHLHDKKHHDITLRVGKGESWLVLIEAKD
jgi:hypothetical protein